MEQGIVKQETKELAMPLGEAWGSEGVDTQDILISKILLQQALSKYVVEGNAKPGQMVDSVSGEVLADKGKSIKLIPIKMFKTISIEKLVDGKWDYQRKEPVAQFPTELEYTENGEQFRRNKELNFYVLREDQASNPDAFPLVLSFRRTSFTAGKALATHFAKAAIGKYPPAAKVFEVASTQQKNDKGTFFVFSGIKQVADTGETALANAYNWFKTIAKTSHKIDDSDEHEEPTTTARADGPSF